jgi:hypothetical protein
MIIIVPAPGLCREALLTQAARNIQSKCEKNVSDRCGTQDSCASATPKAGIRQVYFGGTEI